MRIPARVVASAWLALLLAACAPYPHRVVRVPEIRGTLSDAGVPVPDAIVLIAQKRDDPAEAVWPKNSASELSIFVTLLRYRVHADHCSAKVPQLMPKFAGLMEDLDNRIRGISRDVLASGVFAGMQDKPVPAEIIFALTDSFEDMKHNVERQDAAASCPKTLQQLVEVEDESLKSGLTDALAAVQNMIRNLEREGAR